MRKAIYISLCFLMAAIMILPCGARLDPAERKKSQYNYEEYLEYINEHRNAGDLSERFVYYGQVSLLGNFSYFKEMGTRYIEFHLEDAAGSPFCLEVHPYTDRKAVLYAPIAVSHVARPRYEVADSSIDQVEDLAFMTQLKLHKYGTLFAAVTIGDLTYYYKDPRIIVEKEDLNKEEGLQPFNLDGICWEHNGSTFHLKLYSRYLHSISRDTLVGRLLNVETAEAALEELTAFMDANVDAEEGALQRARIKASLKEHKLSTISVGIAIVAAAIVLPIVIVKRGRKRRQTV